MNDIQVRNKNNLNNTINYEKIKMTFDVNKYEKHDMIRNEHKHDF